MTKKIKFIDLFSGIGGFHQALTFFNFECVFASETDKFAQETYLKNYNILPSGDITKIKENKIPNHDILCAGFPCQAFSISGKQNGLKDSRGTLFYEIVRIARYHTPKLILLENVKNFKKHDNGNTLNILKKELDSIGYNIFYKIINSSNFGVPQKRERIYIVGFRKDLKISNFKFPKDLNIACCLNDIIEEDCVSSKYIIKKRDDIKITKDLSPVICMKPLRVGTVNKGGQGERIYDPMGHAITLSAYGGGIGGKTGLYLINNVIRKLTPRECARIQGFPDDFKIIVSDSQAHKQFGNSLVIPVVKSIIIEILKYNIFREKRLMSTASLGSKTAKDGFKNEKDICLKFENWHHDCDAQKWLQDMGYNLKEISNLIAIQIPTKISIKDVDEYNCSPDNFNDMTKFKKADAQIKLTITLRDIVKIENISLKKANSSADYNQVDKRKVSTYKEMWGFDDEIEKWLKLFTGEVEHSNSSSKDSRRLFLTEMPSAISDKIINFFEKNRILVISDLLKGRGGLSANWLLVTKCDDNSTSWYLADINIAMNFYNQGEVMITPRGSLKIGKIVMQRKGGTPDPTSLQFKFSPCDIFNLKNN
ncbi:MAG: DNA (cytosine-5-)-methyltransferase [Fusobacteriaceae bacterium]